ncbi:MAG: hypothetical protein E6Q97_01305 [Desulfurellales bacterium]|nr:MAG: hypothetical protein E6Q97_01305 [Desulfurellales bacterium]
MKSLSDLLGQLRVAERLRKSPSPIPCRGYEINTPDAHEYDCAYEHPPECERCVVNAGPIDPRTGKRYRKAKASK